MYGVLGEDRSDAETLKELIRRLACSNVSVKTKGYGSCSELLRKGARQLQLFADLGCTRFVVCHDSDGKPPTDIGDAVVQQIVKPAGVVHCCVVVPVEEIEAWILADIGAVTKVITGWSPNPIRNPERIPSPKEHLEKLSRASNKKPRYDHATHNPRVAKYLDLDRVRRICPSFKPLSDFIAPQAGKPKQKAPRKTRKK